MAQRSRVELQDLFKQGAKPTGDDFKDFIESTLNLRDDDIAQILEASNSINLETLLEKARGPLKITAFETDEKLVDFYAGDTKTWSISQNPSEANPGFNLSTEEGSRLFIEKTTGNVGIGTVQPTAKLEVNGSFKLIHGAKINEISTDGTLSDNSNNAVPTEQAVKTYVDRSHKDRLISQDGRFFARLQNDGNFCVRISSDTPGEREALWCSNSQVSDINLKEQITPINQALSKVLSLRGVSFHWQDKTMGEDREIGVIAQEVEQVFPELIMNPDGNSKLVQYDKFAPVLIEAIKEQQQTISQLQKEVEMLKQERVR
jgi:hypothetical protein